jgi:hypothetical protein
MRTRQRLATGLVIALGSAAAVAPAVADVGQDLRSPDAVEAAGAPSTPTAPAAGQDLRSPDAADLSAPAAAVATAEPVVVRSSLEPSTTTGFDWGSAAIGAAGTVGLIAVSLGAFLALHRRRGPVPPSPIAH